MCNGHYPSVILVLSFDDGLKTDVVLARILEAYRLRATFFIVAGNVNKSSMWLSEEDVRWLSEVHEIGSHTLSHPCLTMVSWERLMKELRDPKALLERITGSEVVGFAYPYGVSDARVKKCVKESGYVYARSTEPLWIGINGCSVSLYSLRVTLPLYPLKFVGSICGSLRRFQRVFTRVYMDMCFENVKGFVLKAVKRSYICTFELAKSIVSLLLELAKERNRSYIVSFWGHSWEIMLDKDARSRFEDFLAFISSFSDRHIKVLTMREIIDKAIVRGVNDEP